MAVLRSARTFVAVGWMIWCSVFVLSTASAAKAPVLALEKGSTLSIKLEPRFEPKASAESRLPADESGEADVLSFPGIYTAHYTYQAAPDAATATVDQSDSNSRNWLLESDVIRIECNDKTDGNIVDDSGVQHNNKQIDASVFQSCQGHLLIQSEDEHNDIASSIHSEPPSDDGQQNSPKKNTTPTSHPLLHSLEYNSVLTERWVHPRMQLVKETASKAKSRTPSQSETDNHAESFLRRAESREREKSRDRNDILFREGSYSTIPLFDCYYDYQGTMEWIQDFVARNRYSSLLDVTLTDIGDSWQKTKSNMSTGKMMGHDIYSLTITGKSATTTTSTTSSFDNFFGDVKPRDVDKSKSDADKAPFLIVSATHAREYTPPILVRRWLELLMEKVQARDPDYLSMLEHTEIHWIPYLNPDGRVVAETDEPFRRKNMNNEWTGNTKESLICLEDAFGVDLNRNFPLEWGKKDGSSERPCSSYSRGAGPGDQPETRALVEYCLSIFPSEQRSSNAINASGEDYNVQHIPGVSVETSSTKWRGYDPNTTRGVFVDVHSYGQVYIYPWGNTNSISPNDASYRSALGHIESMTKYDALGPGPNHYGVASGATDDWAYGVLGALAMTWELGSEFHEPCDEFEATHQKHFGAFEYLAKIAPFPFALGKGPVVSTIEQLPSTIAMYYLNRRNEYYDDDFQSNSTRIQTDSAASREIVRMGTNTVFDLGEKIEMLVSVKLPKTIRSNEQPIEFEDGGPLREREDPSSISKIRIFFRGGNPMVGTGSVYSSATDRIGDYWDFDVGDNFSRDNDGGLWHPISFEKDTHIGALVFGRDGASAPSFTTKRTLYFQAIDNVGNVGPVTAKSLTVMVLREIEGDDDEVFDDILFPEPVRSPFPAPSSAQSADSNYVSDNPGSGSWSTGYHDDGRSIRSYAASPGSSSSSSSARSLSHGYTTPGFIFVLLVLAAAVW